MDSGVTRSWWLAIARWGCNCDGIVAMDSIAVGCHWVTCGVARMGCEAAGSGMGIDIR